MATIRLWIAGAILLGAAAAQGEIRLREGMGGVADIGATRCDYYAYIHPNGPTGFNQSVLYWLEGYVHARTGRHLDAFLAGVPDGDRWTFDRIGQHVLDYCTANPGATVADGVVDLWKRLGGGPATPAG
jgi:hypothetical protein